MKKLLPIVAILIAFICGCSPLKDKYPQEKTYQDSITVRGYKIPLPEGTWEIAGSDRWDGGKMFKLGLVKIKGETLQGAVFINVDTTQNDYTGYWAFNYFNREDMLYCKAENNTKGKPHDCWSINHISMQLDPEKPAMKKALNFLKNRNVRLPKLMIETRHLFTGKTDKSKCLDVFYYVNPREYGFDASKEGDWGTSEWYYLRIKNHPKKEKFIEKLKKEGKKIHNELRTNFE